MRKPIAALTVIVVAAAIAVTVMVLVHGRSGQVVAGSPANNGSSRSSSPTLVVPVARLREIGAQLSSPEAATFAKALDPAVAAGLAKAETRPLPAGSTVTIDESSTKVAGKLAAVTAKVNVPGKGDTRWTMLLMLLMLEHGTWFMYGSRQQ